MIVNSPAAAPNTGHATARQALLQRGALKGPRGPWKYMFLRIFIDFDAFIDYTGLAYTNVFSRVFIDLAAFSSTNRAFTSVFWRVFSQCGPSGVTNIVQKTIKNE